MTHSWMLYSCMAIGLSSALVAGNFQAFSEFIMKALVAAQPTSGIEAMQMINRTVIRTGFVTLLIGLAPVTLGLAIYAFINITGAAKIWIISGAIIYILFVVIVTIVGNVPMNEKLDKMDYLAADTATYWQTYGKVWTYWNHVRMVGSLVTAICFFAAGISIMAAS